MALLDITHRGSSFAELAAGMLGRLRGARASYSVYRTTVRELSGLSDRELSDIGLNRVMIRSVAREAAAATQG